MEKKHEPVNTLTFLKDVLICSLGAYGSPEAHYGVFSDQMVTKKQYLTEDELLELIALTGILPGPSSTQTIVAMGHKMGGPILAFLSLLVWALPVIAVMTALSFMYPLVDQLNLTNDPLRYIAPMAVGFILMASYRIGKRVLKDRLTVFLFIFGAVITYFYRSAIIFPMVLLFGGFLSTVASKEKGIWHTVSLRPPYRYLIIFLAFAVASVVLNHLFSHRLLFLFDAFYRYGYMVIGGGQVVIPYMYADLVEVNGFMSASEFLTGFGLVQGLPGPMFSFSAYAGGLASRNEGTLYQISGALISGLGIFLPGVLLIFFVYPVWENLKQMRAIKIALKGITAVAGGLIAIAAIILMQGSGFSLDNIVIMLVTLFLLWSKKVPAPFIVILVLIAGFIL